MEPHPCLCGIVCCHSTNIVPVCPMQALSCTQSVSMSDSMSHNQTNCPTHAFSVLKSDSLSHNQTVCLMHILLTCKNCLESCDFLDSFCTLCLEVRQSVSKSGSLSRSQTILCLTHTICPMQALHRVWYFTQCDTFVAFTPSVHSVSKSVSYSGVMQMMRQPYFTAYAVNIALSSQHVSFLQTY